MNDTNSIITWIRGAVAEMGYANRRLFELRTGVRDTGDNVRSIPRRL